MVADVEIATGEVALPLGLDSGRAEQLSMFEWPTMDATQHLVGCLSGNCSH